MKHKKNFSWLFLLPSLIGVLLFYVVPFLFSFYYALIDNLGERNFVGLKNFADTLRNPLFRQAAGNTLLFIGLCVPLGMALALGLSLCLRRFKHGRLFTVLALLLPLVVPSGSIVYFWKVLFDQNGLLPLLLLKLGLAHEVVAQMDFSLAALIIIYLWKNVSYNIVLFWAGLNWIPKSYYEQMELEGAGGWQQFHMVTWVYLKPTTFVVLLMSIVNSFKVFKEAYLLYGAYPTARSYLLQHYMNNQMRSLNLPKLSSAAYLLFFALGLVLLFLFYRQKKAADTYY